MKLLNLDDSTLMEVNAIRRDGSKLIIKGNIMGTMPVMCALTPAEARSLFGLFDFKTWMFLLTFLFRR